MTNESAPVRGENNGDRGGAAPTSSRHWQVVFLASVVVCCLLVAAVLAVRYGPDFPALVLAVVLACAVTSLVYGFLGGVSEAGFDLGVLKLGGTAATLIGSVWFFNARLEPQFEEIRRSRNQVTFVQHASPSAGWFPVDSTTGSPIAVTFTDPVDANRTKTVLPPEEPTLRLELEEESAEDYLVRGQGLSQQKALGRVGREQLLDALGSVGLKTNAVYGPQRLYLMSEGGEMPEDISNGWGSVDECRSRSLPMRIEVVKFQDSFADYNVFRCDTEDPVQPDHKSRLGPHQAELLRLPIQNADRSFLIALVAADHQGLEDAELREPGESVAFWSSFLVVEIVADR